MKRHKKGEGEKAARFTGEYPPPIPVEPCQVCGGERFYEPCRPAGRCGRCRRVRKHGLVLCVGGGPTCYRMVPSCPTCKDVVELIASS